MINENTFPLIHNQTEITNNIINHKYQTKISYNKLVNP